MMAVGVSVERGAVISECGLFRYRLTRVWDPALRRACYIGLNPSTADATSDDPTIRRCVSFARDWGCGGIEMVNLFAFRATDPAAMLAAADPVGPENDRHIRSAAEHCWPVVAAWGVSGTFRGRDEEVRKILRRVGVAVGALKVTKEGHPGHPLYIRRGTPIVSYLPGEEVAV
jgi:hypothetical protein